jgi:hypothetical protein
MQAVEAEVRLVPVEESEVLEVLVVEVLVQQE